MEDQHPRFNVELIDDVTVVRLNDPALHNMLLISELHDELLAYVQQHEPHKLLVDFQQVTQCSSAVINSLVLARKRLLAGPGTIRLCNMNRQVRHTFGILRLDGTLFQIDNTLAESLEELA